MCNGFQILIKLGLLRCQLTQNLGKKINCGYGMVFIFNTSIIEEELDLIGKII